MANSDYYGYGVDGGHPHFNRPDPPECEECGTGLEPDWKFCPWCGAKQGADDGSLLVNAFERRIDASAHEEPTPMSWMVEGAYILLRLLYEGRCYASPDELMERFDRKSKKLTEGGRRWHTR